MKANPINISLKYFHEFPQSMKLFFVNVQSFLLHKEDLQADSHIMSSDLIAIVEPHLLITNEFSFPNFTPIYCHNCSNTRNSEGILVLRSNALGINVYSSHYFQIYYNLQSGLYSVLETTIAINDYTVSPQTTNGHCLLLSVSIENIHVVFMYKSPKYSILNFLRILETRLLQINHKTICIGDINIDLKCGGDAVISLFEKYNMVSILDLMNSTTNGNTHIDCCFSNFSPTGWLYETYYSYHKAICVTW